MITFFALLAFALSAWLLFDLVAGLRRPHETHQERWARAMSALSEQTAGPTVSQGPPAQGSPVQGPPVQGPPVQRQAPAVESRPGGYDLAA